MTGLTPEGSHQCATRLQLIYFADKQLLLPNLAGKFLLLTSVGEHLLQYLAHVDLLEWRILLLQYGCGL